MFETYSEHGVDYMLTFPLQIPQFDEILTQQLALSMGTKDGKELANDQNVPPNAKNLAKPSQAQKIDEKITKMAIYVKGPMKISKKPRILAVDDNPYILLGLGRLGLGKVSWEVFRRGEEALKRVVSELEKGRVFNLIMVDVDMPDMDGPSLTRKIREAEGRVRRKEEEGGGEGKGEGGVGGAAGEEEEDLGGKEIRTNICGLTTEDDKDFHVYLEAGMDEFLKKPVNPMAMNELLERLQENRLKVRLFRLFPPTSYSSPLFLITHPTPPISSPPFPHYNFFLKKKASLEEKQKASESVPTLSASLPPSPFLNKTLLLPPSLQLLVVDDNNFILLGFINTKTEKPFKADLARNGQMALDKYKERIEKGLVYSCIFIDIEMPMMGGMEVAREIRKIEVNKNNT